MKLYMWIAHLLEGVDTTMSVSMNIMTSIVPLVLSFSQERCLPSCYRFEISKLELPPMQTNPQRKYCFENILDSLSISLSLRDHAKYS